MVTIILVMEIATLERFLIKCFFRMLGTLAGIVLTITCACLTDRVDHHPAVVISMFFLVILANGVLSKRNPTMSYVFTMTSVTFAVSFAGYVQNGWKTMLVRLTSVSVGGLIAFITVVLFNVFIADLSMSMSSSVLLNKLETLFTATFTAIDIAVITHDISDATDRGEEFHLNGRTLQKEVVELLKLNERTKVKKVQSSVQSALHRHQERTKAEKAKPSIISALQRHQERTGATIASLVEQTKAVYSDIQLIQSISFGELYPSVPNYIILAQQLHLFFRHAANLALTGHVEPQSWRVAKVLIESVRVQLGKARECFVTVWRQTRWDSLREFVGWENQERRSAILSSLQRASGTLAKARAELVLLEAEVSAASSTWLKEHRRLNHFCHGLSSIVSELAVVALIAIEVMEFSGGKTDEVKRSLMEVSGNENVEQVVKDKINWNRVLHRDQCDDAYQEEGDGEDAD